MGKKETSCDGILNTFHTFCCQLNRFPLQSRFNGFIFLSSYALELQVAYGCLPHHLTLQRMICFVSQTLISCAKTCLSLLHVWSVFISLQTSNFKLDIFSMRNFSWGKYSVILAVLLQGLTDPPFSFLRYCGELSSLTLTSNTNILDVRFHSDESFTDKGFRAEYSAYDPSNRESTVLSNTPDVDQDGYPVTNRGCSKPADTEQNDSERERCRSQMTHKWSFSFSNRAAETGRVQLKGSANHRKHVYWFHFICHCQSGNTPLSILFGLYAVPQFDWNGFIIALISWDKHWQNDGCRRHKPPLPCAQFVITVNLFSFSALSVVFHVVPQLVPISLHAILECASQKICSVTAGTTAAIWATRWSVVSSTQAIFCSPH